MIETGILSCVLAENCLADIIDMLRPADFLGHETRKIYEKMLDNFHKHLPITDDCILTDGLDFDKSKLLGHQPVLREDLKQYCNQLKAIKNKKTLKGLIMKAHIEIQTKPACEVKQMLEIALNDIVIGSKGLEMYKAYDLAKEDLKSLDEPLTQYVKIDDFEFDNFTNGWGENELVGLAGNTGMGKTGYALHLALRTAQTGTRVCFYSLEMTKKELVRRLICSLASVDMNKVKNHRLSKGERIAYENAVKEFRFLPIIINDTPDLSVDQVCDSIKKECFENGTKIFFVDYLQKLRFAKGRSRTEEIEEAQKKLKNSAKKNLITIVELIQLNRDNTKRQDKRPMLSDCKDSSAIEMELDKAIMLYRESYFTMDNSDTTLEVIVNKNRGGKVGKYFVEYFRNTQKIVDKRNLNKRFEL